MPGKRKPDPVERHVHVDLALRQAAAGIMRRWLEFCDWAAECLQEKYYERFGFVDPLPYFEERVGIRYRTLRRFLSVHEAIKRLPPAEQKEARDTFAEIGAHKASIIAAAVGDDRADWRMLADFARKASESALQERVSAETGRARTPSGDEPGAKLYKLLLNNCPPEAKDLLEQTFDAGFRLMQSKNAWAVLLALCEETAPGWLERVEKGVE